MSSIDKFKTILKETEDLFLKVEIDQINSEHLIIDDLGIDSLTRVTIFYEIQDHFDIDDDEMLCAKWNTVNDILEYISTK